MWNIINDVNNSVIMHGRAYEAEEGPAVPLLDLISVQRFVSRRSENEPEIADHAMMRSLMRPLIHWATRKQDRHGPIGQRWCK